MGGFAFVAFLSVFVVGLQTPLVNGLICKVGTRTEVSSSETANTLVSATCPTNYLCARTDTTDSTTITSVASCQTATACDNLCTGTAGCVMACCNDADDCNNVAVTMIKDVVRCQTGDLSAQTPTVEACASTEYCRRKEVTNSDTSATAITGSCGAQTANDALCSGTDDQAPNSCVSKSCNHADECNSQTVANMNVLSCSVGSANGAASAPCDDAAKVCAKTLTGSTIAASCQLTSACGTLCSADGCMEACCSNADDCNSGAVAAITANNALLFCLVGTVGTSQTVTQCTANQICGRKEVTASDGTVTSTTSCQDSVASCDALCGSDANCISACCSEDNCNRQSVADMRNIVTCMTGTVNGPLTAPTTCEAGKLCGRTETGNTNVGSCVTQAECDDLCKGVANCKSACCNDADRCNGRTVAEMKVVLRCESGTTTTGNLPNSITCAANELCARKETTSGSDTTTVGSCQTQANCESLCNGQSNCASACCNDGDNCNSLPVTDIINVVRCGIDVDNANSMTCAAGSLCGKTTITNGATTGSCSTQAECDDLCANTADCTSACCNDADNCNSRTVAQMAGLLQCASGSATNGNLPGVVTCAANELCARKETTSGSTTTTVGSCQTQANCETLCSGDANCASACCNDGDNCNSLSVKDITNVVRCGIDANNANSMTCAAGSLCGKTTITGGATTGSCSTPAQCDGLCANTADCTSACCNDADNCNSRTVAQMAGLLQCAHGSATNGNLPGVVTCNANELCARTQSTVSTTTTTVGSCQSQRNCETLCVGLTSCVSACCNDGDMCNSRLVADMIGVVRCGTGTVTTTSPAPGVFTVTSTCAANELCARKETLTGQSLETVGSCQTQSACDAGLCGNANGCTATCCNNADGCNTLENPVTCFDGTTTQSSSATPDYSSVNACPGKTDVCSRTETTSGNVVTIAGACQSTAAACDQLCQGVAGCVSACCSEDSCNTESVSTMTNVVTCLTGTSTTGTLTSTTTCQAGELCALKVSSVTVSGTTTVTTVGSCATQEACEALCDGVPDCASACCNDADSCNSRPITDIINVVRCGSGENNANMLTCAAGSLCGKTTITGGATTGSCSTPAQCDDLCAGTANCASACCNNADNCNSRTVAQMAGLLQCASGSATDGNIPGVVTCAANELCARTQSTVSTTTTTVGSCQSQINCETLCVGLTSCVSACCNDGDMCNSLPVSDITNVVRCGTGTKTTTSPTAGVFTETTTCTANQQCARTETLTGTSLETVGSCQAQADCAGLCGSATGCTATCCNNADGCNTLENPVMCFVGSTTQSSSATPDYTPINACPGKTDVCSRTETTSGNVVNIVGACQSTVAACDVLCQGTAGCVSACCSEDSCNTESVTTMRNVVTCLTGTSTTGTLATATACQAGELCARNETTVTSGGTTTVTTVGSCATQAACDLLCTGVTGCVSACCNDVDRCNSQTVDNMDNTLRCASGSVTTGTLTASLTCATGSQCGRKETNTTTNGATTLTTVGSCNTNSECTAGLCGNTQNCVSSCCSDADTCNSLTVAEQTGRVCSVGTMTKVGSAAATGSLVPTHCGPNAYCGKQVINSTDADNVLTMATVGSCQASVASCNLICADDMVCVSACCNDNTALCNNDTPANIKNILTCHTGSVTDGTLTASTTCTAGQMCARKETTASDTTTTEGSCVAQSACATLCGTTAGCVSSCCDFADLCNSLTVAQSNALKCYVGTSTSANLILDISVQVCNTGEQCGRTQTTTTSGGTTTTTVVGSCSTTAACNNLCGTNANCVSNCCNTNGCNASPIPTTTSAGTTTAAATTTSGSVRTAGINIFFMICAVVFGHFMA